MAIFSFENKYVRYYGLEDKDFTKLYEKYRGLLIYDTASNEFNDIVDISDGDKLSFIDSNRTYTNNVVIYGITAYFSDIQNYINETQLSLDSVIITPSGPAPYSQPLSSIIQKVGFLKYSNNTWYPSVSWYLSNNVHTLKINNKEVLQVKRNSDNKILYQH